MDYFEIHPYRRQSAGQESKVREGWKLPSWPPKGKVLDWPKLAKDSLNLVPWSIAGFLMGRGILFDEMLPFGMAYLAAILVLKAGYWPIVLLAVGTGSFTVVSGLELWATISSLLLMVMVYFAARIVEEKRRLYLPGLVFAISVLSKTGIVAAFGPSFYKYMVILFEALAGAGLTYVFLIGIATLPQFIKKLALAIEETIALSVLAGSALIGLEGIYFGQVSLMGIISKVMVLIAGFMGGMAPATTLGTLVGLIPSLSSSAAPLLVASYALGGLLAGAFRRYGKLGVAVGFAMANVLLSIYLSGGKLILNSFIEVGLAIAIFVALPVNVFNPLNGFSQRKKVNDKIDQQAMNLTSKRIKEFARVFNELSKTFEQISTEAQQKDLESWPSLLKEIAGQACDGCAKHRLCWEKDMSRTNKIMMDMLTWIDINGKLTTNQLSDHVRKRCIRSRELVVVLNCLYDIYKVYRNWNKKLIESRELVSNQLKGVSSIMDNLATEIHQGNTQNMVHDQGEYGLRLEFGVAQLPKDGASVSGDSFSWVNLRDGKIAIILSDGMGCGQRAAVDSSATVSLLEQLMETGFDRDLAVRTVNSILVLRSADETFATVDLAVVNRITGEAEFIKIGSAASFIKRSDKVGVIRSTSLPIGILHSVEADTISQTLKPGDFLVMVTDGVLDMRKEKLDDCWIIDLLENYQGENTQEIAELIINEATINGRNRVSDDMTVIVTKIASV